MSSTPHPPVDLEQQIAALFGASPVRIAIVRVLLEHDEVTVTDLMDALSVTRNGVNWHLRQLDEAGLLIERRATHPRGAGAITYWRLNRDAAARSLWPFMGQLMGRVNGSVTFS